MTLLIRVSVRVKAEVWALARRDAHPFLAMWTIFGTLHTPLATQYAAACALAAAPAGCGCGKLRGGHGEHGAWSVDRESTVTLPERALAATLRTMNCAGTTLYTGTRSCTLFCVRALYYTTARHVRTTLTPRISTA